MKIFLIVSFFFLITTSLYSVELEDIRGWEDNKDIDSLIQVLGDPVDLVRSKAAEALEKLNEPLGRLIYDSLEGSEKAKEELIARNDPRAIIPLSNTLKSLDLSVRREGQDFLRRVEYKESVYSLIRTLADLSPTAHNGVLTITNEIGGKLGMDFLSTVLHNTDFEIREALLTVYNSIEKGHLVDPLLKFLDDEDPQIREVAALILGYLGDKRAINPLINLLGDRYENIRMAVSKALTRLEEDLGNLVYESLLGSEKFRQQLIKRNDPRVINPICKILEEGQPKLRKEAAKILSLLPDNRAFELLILSLSNTNSDIRENVVLALEGNDDERAFTNLIKALADSTPSVREAAAFVLGSNGDMRAIDPLINTLGDRYPDVRNATAAALEKLGEPIGSLTCEALKGHKKAIEAFQKNKDQRIIPSLNQALNYGDSTLRENAVTVLSLVGGKESVDSLIKRLSDEDTKVRVAVVSSLRVIGDDRAVMPLIKSLDDPKSNVRNAAAWALTKFPDERAIEPLLKTLKVGDRDLSLAATSALAGALDKVAAKRAVDPLLEVLKSRDPELRQAAIIALGKIEDDRVVTAFTKALGDENSDVRKAAVESLAMKPGEKTVELILRVFSDEAPDVRNTVTKTLSTIGEPLDKLIKEKDLRVVEPLIKCLRVNDQFYRRRAAGALGQMNEKRAVNGLIRMAAGWNIRDRIVASRALIRIKQDKMSDYVLTILGIIFRPASLIYIACIGFIFVFIPYKFIYRLRET